MSALHTADRHWSRWIEYGFVAAIAIALIYTAGFFYEHGHLPQPFFYEPWGTFMDWYSLVHFAQFGGAYDVGGTIYPPLSFVILRIFSFRSCYVDNNSEWSRDCDWSGVIVLIAILAINVVLTFITFYKHDRTTFLPRAFALSLGLPMVFTFERGNLLLFCYTCVLLAFGPLLRSARLRWLFGGMALNFKVYLIGALLAPLLRRRWLQTEGMLVSGIAVYLASFAILGDGSPFQIFRDIRNYATGFGSTRLQDLWYPSSLIPAITLLNGESFQVSSILDSNWADLLLVLAKSMMRATQILIMLAAGATWLRPETVPRHRIIFFAIAMAVTTSEVGGYTEVLLLLFVFMERWRGWGRPAALILAYLLCLPIEYVPTKLPPIVQNSWLIGGAEVYGEYGVGVFALLRPLVAMLIVWCLAAVTLRDVWADIRVQGWKTRWRFRRDFPILAGEGEARPPAP